MKVIEYGSRQAPLMTIFQCTAEPWWVFNPSAEELSNEFHILLFAADGHGTDCAFEPLDAGR